MNNEDANYVVNGNLTIKDITKGVSFRAKVDNANGMVSVSTPPFTIDRTEWDIKFRSTKFFEGLADKAINDDIGLQVQLMAK
jgi:polyisoprenoid-binding protein YceI